MAIKTLLLDIETAPNTAYTWGLFKQNITLSQLVKPGRLLCWAAGWKGSDETIFSSEHMTSRRTMMKEMHKLLCEADEVVTYNGTTFDLPIINREFIELGLPPPSPYKNVDLLRTVRRNFRFNSNKLQHIVERLGIGSKLDHSGFQLWVDCMAGDEAAWEIMEEYNRMDVALLDELYDLLQPWSANLINRSVFEQEMVCPKCGSNHYQKRGLKHTNAGMYQQYQCGECKGWFRSNKTLAQPEKFLLV